MKPLSVRDPLVPFKTDKQPISDWQAGSFYLTYRLPGETGRLFPALFCNELWSGAGGRRMEDRIEGSYCRVSGEGGG